MTHPAAAPAHNFRFCASGVGVSRGGVRIVDGVSLVLQPGDAVILRGPNGAGKTTLLRAFAGLLKPDAGDITVETKSGEKIDDPKSGLIYCGPSNATKNALTVDENLKFWAALYGASTGAVDSAQKAFRLGDYAGRKAGVLSTGLARRLGLARLLIANRAIWFVDEPTASLDRASAGEFARLVEAHRARGGGVMIATHDAFSLDGARSFHLAQEADA